MGDVIVTQAAQIPPISDLLERLRPLTKPEACIDGTPMVPISQPLLTAVVITLGQVAATPVQNRGEDDLEAVARIIEPSAWVWHDKFLTEAESEVAKGRRESLRRTAKLHVARSLEKASAIRNMEARNGD